MKSLRPLLAALLIAGALKSSADTVELNGLCALFGNNLGFFVLYQPAATQPVKFTLSEGESQYGITLVTIEASHHRAQIEQCGVKRFLYVQGVSLDGAASDDSPPSIASAGNGAVSDDDQRILTTFLSSEQAQRIQSGNASGLAGGAATKTKSNENTASNTAQNKRSSEGTSTTDSNGAQTKAGADDLTWYQESLGIEQDRLTTAEDVLAGRATPLPRTPLTPANTPVRLIGKETFFSNHIANYVVPGYTQPLASLP